MAEEADMECIVSEEENKANTASTIKNWNLGPLKPSDEPGANKPFWTKMADIWQVGESVARKQLCANCEYFENTPEMMMMMDTIPRNEFDTDAGGRGYCHRFDFICHNLRSCQAWEYREYGGDDEEDCEDEED